MCVYVLVKKTCTEELKSCQQDHHPNVSASKSTHACSLEGQSFVALCRLHCAIPSYCPFCDLVLKLEDRCSLAPAMDILSYSEREWKGNTAKSALIRKVGVAAARGRKCFR